MKAFALLVLFFSTAALANPAHLFTCALNGGGTIAIFADRDMRLASMSMDAAALAQVPQGIAFPRYLRVSASSGDAKGGFKAVGFGWADVAPDAIARAAGLTVANVTLDTELTISFSKDVRAGKALVAGQDLEFSQKDSMTPSLQWRVFDTQKAQISGATYVPAKKIQINRCVVGNDLKSANDIETYLTR